MIKERSDPVSCRPKKKERREEHSSETYSLPSAPQQYSFMVKDTKREEKRRYFGEKKKKEKIKDLSEENEGPKSKTEGQRKEFSL